MEGGRARSASREGSWPGRDSGEAGRPNRNVAPGGPPRWEGRGARRGAARGSGASAVGEGHPAHQRRDAPGEALAGKAAAVCVRLGVGALIWIRWEQFSTAIVRFQK